MEGWISLHRKIMENVMYFSEPFTKMQAWIDLILIANYKPGEFYLRGNKIKVGRGQIGNSSRTLGERWKWSRKKVITFLDELSDRGQIIRSKSNLGTIITITNYDEYQSFDIIGEPQKGPLKEPLKEPQNLTQEEPQKEPHNFNINSCVSDVSETSTLKEEPQKEPQKLTHEVTPKEPLKEPQKGPQLNKYNNIIIDNINTHARTREEFCVDLNVFKQKIINETWRKQSVCKNNCISPELFDSLVSEIIDDWIFCGEKKFSESDARKHLLNTIRKKVESKNTAPKSFETKDQKKEKLMNACLDNLNSTIR